MGKENFPVPYLVDVPAGRSEEDDYLWLQAVTYALSIELLPYSHPAYIAYVIRAKLTVDSVSALRIDLLNRSTPRYPWEPQNLEDPLGA